MLEFAVIKTTPQSSEAPSQHARKPAGRDEKDTATQEFQTEYEAASDDAARDSREMDEAPNARPDRALDEHGQEKKAESGEQGSEPEKAAGKSAVLPDELAASEAEIAPVDANRPPAETAGSAEARQPASLVSVANVATIKPGGEVAASTEVGEAAEASVSDKAEATKKPEAALKTTAETIVMSKVAGQSAKSEPLSEGTVRQPDDRLAQRAPEAAARQSKTQISTAPAPQAADRATDNPATARRAEPEEPFLRRRNPPLDSARPTPAAAPVVLAQKSAQLPFQPITKGEAAKDKIELVPVVGGDLDALGGWETRSTASQTTPGQLAQVLSRAETPSMIARQMAEALQRLPDRPVEISLNPRELGRVKMSISAAEAGITVSVLAERPETLELMRRNIEELTHEFQALGYEDIAFAFSEGEENQSFSDEQNDETESAATRLDLTPEEKSDTTSPHDMAVTTGVDIRL